MANLDLKTLLWWPGGDNDNNGYKDFDGKLDHRHYDYYTNNLDHGDDYVHDYDC